MDNWRDLRTPGAGGWPLPRSRGRLDAADREHVARALDHLALAPLADRFLDELSGGQRRRAFVAMREGRVVADGTPNEIVTPAALEAIHDMLVRVERIDGRPVCVFWR